jgi:Ca-activated chloride channel family protein
MRRMALLLVAVALAVPMGWAAGQEAEAPAGALLIILDASGSMNTLDEDGVPFFDKAKEAVLRLVEALPEDMVVGLRVYGHREPNTDPIRGCQDTELVVPVGPLDREAIRTAVDGLSASGYTPIGVSLLEAARDLPETGARSIVLISDGEDTCAPPDPCRVAEELFGEAFDVRIESVGFLVGTGSAAEQQLRCISEVTGGAYRAVEEANELVAALGEVGEQVAGWQPSLVLDGALEQALAPELPLALADEALLAQDPRWRTRSTYRSLLMPGETRWWQFDLWMEEEVTIGGTLFWPAGIDASGTLETILLDPEGNRVGFDRPGFYDMSAEIGGSAPIAGVTTSPGLGDQPPVGPPLTGTYLLGYRWEAEPEVFLGELELLVEIQQFGETERATQQAGTLEPADAASLALEPYPAAGQDLSRPYRTGQRVFRVPIASGETRWFRLDMEPGEAANVLATFPADRLVGGDIEGAFSVQLTTVDGSPVGMPHAQAPDGEAEVGGDDFQVRVSSTTGMEPDPWPQTVLIGLTWEGAAGQESEALVMVETVVDPARPSGGESGVTTTTRGEEPVTALSTATTGEAVAGGETESGDRGLLVPVLIGVGALVVAAGVGIPLAVRRRRSR